MVQIESRPGALVIGRRRGSDIELPFAAVSEQHAHLSQGDQGWRLEDLGSANGTTINGRRLTPSVAQTLSVGDVLRLADVELVLEGEGQRGERAAATESTATLARRLVSDLFGARRRAEVPRLIVTDGPARGHELAFGIVGCRYRVGRGNGCHLVVADDDMSREHAEFERRWDGVFVRDLGSKNGVLNRGERLAVEARLSDGDVLRLGQTTLRLEDPEDRYLRQMEEAEARGGQAANSGAESSASSDREGRAGGLADTHTFSQSMGEGSEQRNSAEETRQRSIASPHSVSVGGGRRASRHGAMAFMVIAALVLVATIALALSFLLGS